MAYKASDLVKDLSEFIAQYGNLEVVNEDDESVKLEFNDDGEEEVFVIS